MYSRQASKHFLAATILVATLTLTSGIEPGANESAANEPNAAEQIDCDLLVVGGTESGWAAAIQAARMGVGSTVIVHDGQWLGGQFTEQALACVDENKGVGKFGWGVDWHPMKRSFHRSGLFRELMDAIESFNAAKYGDSMPGRPYHGPSTYRPVEAEAIFRQMLEPLISGGQVRLILNRYPVDARVTTLESRPRLERISFAPVGKVAADLHVTASMTIDASDWGEAINVSGAAFQCGPDPKSRYHEPSAPADMSNSPVNEMNPITWAMIVQQSGGAGGDSIDRPSRFDDRYFVRTSRPSLQAMRDLDWDRPVQLGSIPHWPDRDQQIPRQLSVYNVRRLVEGATSREARSIILLNYMLGQDYPLERLPRHVADALEQTEPGSSAKNIVRMTRTQREIIFADARRHSLALLYHLQNFVHEHAGDTTNSFRNFTLSDEFGTTDRLPPKPYIRESLRLKAMYMMREQDGRNVDGLSKTMARERFAQVIYPDGVLCWQFHYDFHRTGRAYLNEEGDAGPWIDFEKPGRHTHHMSDRSVFPLRSLIPESMDGLIGGQKNLGYSSIVCAAIRLHDQCIAIGQAAGATAAVSLRRRVAPREIPFDRDLLEQVREGLCGGTDGVPLLLYPYRDLSPKDDAFIAINRLAVCGVVASDPYEVDFRGDDPASFDWQQKMIDLAGENSLDKMDLRPRVDVTRGQFCQLLWQEVDASRLRRFVRIEPLDADADGILDVDDPTPFTAAPPIEWSVRPPASDEDGVPDERRAAKTDPKTRLFNFGPSGGSHDSGAIQDFGSRYEPTAGYGWERSLEENSRRRGQQKEPIGDTFLFTRDQARWECDLANGKWQVSVCVGDSAHPQPGQRVTVEGNQLIDNVDTAAGRFCERSVVVTINDRRLTIDLGPQRPGQNTCLNWLQITPAGE
jgi:hypothetical protein